MIKMAVSGSGCISSFLLNQERRSNEGNQSSVENYLLRKPEIERLAVAVEEKVVE